jgi:proline dehydrogenase
MAFLLRFARQWVAGEQMDDALRVAHGANARGLDAIVNHLGEHYRERAPVEATRQEYLKLLAEMEAQGIRGSVSLKPTQFGILIDKAFALSKIHPVLDAVKAQGRVLWLDMEHAQTKEDTIWICEQLLTVYDKIGVCVQANLRRTPEDVDRLIRDGIRMRLVKGAYRETPDIAFQSKGEVDRAFLDLLDVLFEKASDFAVASHDGRMIARALELARMHATPFEFAMLQGVRDPLKRELRTQGHRVAEYIPYGPNWLPYFSRRLRERPRNMVTMVRSLVSG